MTYTLIVAALSLIGGWVPLRSRPDHARLQIYLSLAAGALLGAALFHLLPEAAEHAHGSFGLPAALGVMLVFFLQRYLAPHSHEPHASLAVESLHQHDMGATGDSIGFGHEPGDHAHHDHGYHGHVHHGHLQHDIESIADPEVSAKPKMGSATAIMALCVHSFFDGVAIGAVSDGSGAVSASLTAAVFLSVLIHKPLDGLSVSVLLMDTRMSRGSLWAVQFGYAALVPIGALMFHLTRGAIAEPTTFIGYTLAFSAGTFLSIALTDLLPELHFHAHDRHKLSAALLTGLAVMWATSLIGHPAHEKDEHLTNQPAVEHAKTDDHSNHEH